MKVNGKTAKPATPLKVGDRVEARLHDRERICDVTTLVMKRVGAPIAETCFVDLSPRPHPRGVRAAVRAGPWRGPSDET